LAAATSRAGDAVNVILSASGYNLRLVLPWLRIILRVTFSRYSTGQMLNM
jgi:hypothetical protein